MSDLEQEQWAALARRCEQWKALAKALDNLLAYYRVGRQPPAGLPDEIRRLQDELEGG